VKGAPVKRRQRLNRTEVIGYGVQGGGEREWNGYSTGVYPGFMIVGVKSHSNLGNFILVRNTFQILLRKAHGLLGRNSYKEHVAEFRLVKLLKPKI
jgi:hypothetical protein